VQLAGGKGARIAVMPSAAGNPERSGANIAATLNKYGASAFVVPVSVRLKNTDYKAAAEDETLARSIREAGGVLLRRRPKLHHQGAGASGRRAPPCCKRSGTCTTRAA
jgi:hypothetical protein